MRGFDRDLIRGGHYGQRSCEPHKQAEHMAAPTSDATFRSALNASRPAESLHTGGPRPATNTSDHGLAGALGTHGYSANTVTRWVMWESRPDPPRSLRQESGPGQPPAQPWETRPMADDSLARLVYARSC